MSMSTHAYAYAHTYTHTQSRFGGCRTSSNSSSRWTSERGALPPLSLWLSLPALLGTRTAEPTPLRTLREGGHAFVNSLEARTALLGPMRQKFSSCWSRSDDTELLRAFTIALLNCGRLRFLGLGVEAAEHLRKTHSTPLIPITPLAISEKTHTVASIVP